MHYTDFMPNRTRTIDQRTFVEACGCTFKTDYDSQRGTLIFSITGNCTESYKPHLHGEIILDANDMIAMSNLSVEEAGRFIVNMLDNAENNK